MISGKEKFQTGDFVYLNSLLLAQSDATGSRFTEPFQIKLEIIDLVNEIAVVEWIAKKEIRSEDGERILQKEERIQKAYDLRWLSHKNEIELFKSIGQ